MRRVACSATRPYKKQAAAKIASLFQNLCYRLYTCGINLSGYLAGLLKIFLGK
jgi:predicted esterase YcpF (UPF0227 family)